MKDDHYNASVNEKHVHELGFMFDGKFYLFQHLPIGSFSSPNIFTELILFVIWALKQDIPDLYCKEVEESLINLDAFIKEAEVKRESTAKLAILFHHLNDMLEGHPVEDKAWEQFSHSEKVLKSA